MLKNTVIKKIISLFILLTAFLLQAPLSHVAHAAEIARLVFPDQKNAELLVNDETSIPPFSTEIPTYKPVSFSALTPNTISFGKTTKTVSVKKIKPNDFITLLIGARSYRLALFPKEMPAYEITQNHAAPGYLLFTPFEGSCRKPSYAYMIRSNGDLIYFRRNARDQRCVSDFKKTILPDGRVRYSLMEQEKNMPPFAYWSGSLLVMDDQLKPLKRLRIQSTKTHPELGVDHHDSLILDDNHFILTTYYHTETLVPGHDQPTRIAATLLQEIKDNRVVFEWNSADHPELYGSCLHQCNYTAVPYQDYLHFNAVAVDPRDNNLILSFAGQSSILKIDRLSGRILWTLGGLNDDFNLPPTHRFASQHAVSILPNGWLMLFDNHSTNALNRQKGYTVPHLNTRARILMFDLDEKKLKVKKFREITLPYPSPSMGSVYRTDHNTFIVGYGSNHQVAAQELSADGRPVFELRLKDNMTSYRVRKYKTLD